MTEEYVKPTRKLNRHAKKRAKSGIFWCGSCDAQLVGAGSKCPNCGYVHDKGIFKKQDDPV